MSDPARLVLVADDHPDSRAVFRAILEHHGRSVLDVCDGEACLRVARERRPDVIVLDLRMPAITGWDVALHLKRDPVTAGIPLLAVTASAFPEDHARALEAGCSRVLVKPVGVRELLANVDELLG